MQLSKEQIEQVHALLQEYATTDHVLFREEKNNSGLGPTEYADFYNYNGQLLGSVDITDVGQW